jgi:hypothetical protein
LGLGVWGPAFFFCGGVGFRCGESVVVRNHLVSIFLELFRSLVRALGPRGARVLAEAGFERDVQVDDAIGDVAGGVSSYSGTSLTISLGHSGAGARVIFHGCGGRE